MTHTSSDADDPLSWACEHTPILRSFQDEYGETRPLKN
jgi:adenosylhomocysteinase